MTNIHLMGILGKKFGNLFKARVTNAMSALKAIDANKNGFMKEVINCKKNNLYYSIVCDETEIKNKNDLLENKKIKNIYIFPIIIGSGFVVAGFMLGVSAAAAAEMTIGILIATVVDVAIAGIVSLAVSFLTSSSEQKLDMPNMNQNFYTGGATSTVNSAGKSYNFSNFLNAASQGTPISIGYGSLLMSSNVIQVSFKSYPTNEIFTKSFF